MRLLQHLVVPTFVIDAQRRVIVWNRACERLTGVAAAEVLGTRKHWQAFYEKRRYCLADLVALGRQDKIGELYTEYVETQRREPRLQRGELVRDAAARQSPLSRHRRRPDP